MDPEVHKKQAARVLVVDDDEVVLASVSKILSREGLRVECVSSATEGLARLDADAFDLLMVDLMMPVMDGIELLGEARSRGVQIPAVMITGYPTIRTAVKALARGAVGYVTKPFTRKELVTPVLRALHQKRSDPLGPVKHGTPTAEPSAAEPGTTVFLPNHSWARFRQDRTVEVGVEETFLAACGELTGVALPDENAQVEQGFSAVTLTNEDGVDHEVMMPLSGQVIEQNAAAPPPGELSGEVWLVRLLPSLLGTEMRNLVLRPRRG